MDKTSVKVIDYLKHHSNGKLLYYDNSIDIMASKLNLNSDASQACIRYLLANDYLEYIKSGGRNIGVTLSHKAIHYKEFKKINFINYIKDKWISIISLTISIISLLVATFK